MISAFGVVHDFDQGEISKATAQGGEAVGRILARNMGQPGKTAARKTARATDLGLRGVGVRRGRPSEFEEGFARGVGKPKDTPLARRRMKFLQDRAAQTYGEHGEKLKRKPLP